MGVVSAPGGGVVSQHAPRQTPPCEQNDKQVQKYYLGVTGASFMTVRMLFLITHLLFQLYGRLHSMTE